MEKNRKSKGYNPTVSKGDRIRLYFMEDESVSPGSLGTVIKVGPDPFDSENDIIYVRWDNGSNLSILPSIDLYKLYVDEIKESVDSSHEPHNFFSKNKDLFEYFDWRFFKNYLTLVRDSGVTNMFGSAQFLYMGRERIDRYYGENPPNEDAFNEVLDLADRAKDKLVSGTVKFLKSKNKTIDIPTVTKYSESFAQNLFSLYVSFFNYNVK